MSPGQSTLRFDGPDMTDRDNGRLADQFGRILGLMKDGNWRSLRAISRMLGYPEASVSAQLRHARKPRFGSYTVQRTRDADSGTWFYRVLAADPSSTPTPKQRKAATRIAELTAEVAALKAKLQAVGVNP